MDIFHNLKANYSNFYPKKDTSTKYIYKNSSVDLYKNLSL